MFYITLSLSSYLLPNFFLEHAAGIKLKLCEYYLYFSTWSCPCLSIQFKIGWNGFCKSFNFLFILQSIQLYWNVSFYILVHESGNGKAMDFNNILVRSLLTVWREQKKHILIYQYFVAGQHLSGDWILVPMAETDQ